MMPNRNPNLGPPEYKPISEIPVMDYYMYLQYDYWFIDYVSTTFKILFPFYLKSFHVSDISTSTAPACKTSGLKDTKMHLK